MFIVKLVNLGYPETRKTRHHIACLKCHCHVFDMKVLGVFGGIEIPLWSIYLYIMVIKTVGTLCMR